MAKSRKGRKSSRLPLVSSATQLTIPLNADSTDGAGTALVKVPKQIGMVNHRLYRESMVYRVSFEALAASTTSKTEYRFYTLPNNWFTMGAIKFAHRQWKASIQDELAQGTKLAKWYDFRINEQDPDGTWDALRATLFDGDTNVEPAVDEYSETTLVGADGSTAKAFHLFGAISNSYNIFTEYAKYLNQRDVADAVNSSTAYDGLHAGIESAEKLTEEGDLPPYDRDFGSNWDKTLIMQDQIYWDGDGGIGRLSTKQFDAPLGLVFITKEVDGSATDILAGTPQLLLRASPGKYKGVNAQPIVRMDNIMGATAKSLK